eukprot:bmy_15144T0
MNRTSRNHTTTMEDFDVGNSSLPPNIGSKSTELFEKPDRKLCYPMIYEEQHLYHVVGVEIKRLVDALPKVIQQLMKITSIKARGEVICKYTNLYLSIGSSCCR